jgi:hypothetical protein
MLLITVMLANTAIAQAQQPTANLLTARLNTKDEPRFTDLFRQARSVKRAGFSLMPVSGNVGTTAPAYIFTPMAAPNLQVIGNGTIGRLTKWTAFTSSNSVIGNSTIFEDKFGMVGIGTDAPTSRLTVQGLIESQGAGGVKFPDGTIQTTAGVAPNQVVNSLNGLTGQVMLAAGSNITITPKGNTLTIASGTQNPALSAFQAQVDLPWEGAHTVSGMLAAVPANKRLVIEYVTIRADTTVRVFKCRLTTIVSGTEIRHSILPIALPDDDDIYVADRQVRIYADGGTNVEFFVSRISTNMGEGNTARVVITISGHLVDIP